MDLEVKHYHQYVPLYIFFIYEKSHIAISQLASIAFIEVVTKTSESHTVYSKMIQVHYCIYFF